MHPPIYQVCAASPQVMTLLGGSGEIRLAPFGLARDDKGKPLRLPYAVWQQVSGFPENVLRGGADIDQFSIQVDVYGKSGKSAEEAALALRDAIEPHGQITAWRGCEKDNETEHYRLSFDVDWYVERI